MEKWGQIVRLGCSEVRNPLRLGDDWGMKNSKEVGEFTLARKAAKDSCEVPVPQTDTGRRQENCKTNGITLVKELGKMTP